MSDQPDIKVAAMRCLRESTSKNVEGKYATTIWMKHIPGNLHCPFVGERCLWSMVIDNIRVYGYGDLKPDGTLFIIYPGNIGSSVGVNDTVYFAQIIQGQFDETD